MSIKNIKGDLLSSDCVIRCHVVNCCGAMEGGIAAQVKEQYPEAVVVYEGLCKTLGTGLLGEVQLVPCHDGTVIANMFAQSEQNGNKSVTNIQALEKCFERILLLAAKTGLPFGFPKNMGAGYGRGDWNEISSLIDAYFAYPADKCFVVEYEEKQPAPTEELTPAPGEEPAPIKETKEPAPAPAEEPEPAEETKQEEAPKKKAHVQICAMGASANGAGGWGVVLQAGKTVKTLFGGGIKTTTEDMVLTAMIYGLSALKWPCHVNLFINSFAIMNAIGANSGKPIGSTGLWNQLTDIQAKHIVSIHMTDNCNKEIVERCKDAASHGIKETIPQAS